MKNKIFSSIMLSVWFLLNGCNIVDNQNKQLNVVCKGNICEIVDAPSNQQKIKKGKRNVYEITNNNDYFKSADKAIVKFCIDSCTPCKRYTPFFEETAKKYKNKGILFCSVDGNHNKELCKKYHVGWFPTTLLFEKGNMIYYAVEYGPTTFVEWLINKFDKIKETGFSVSRFKKLNRININNFKFKKGLEYNLILPNMSHFDLDHTLKRYDLYSEVTFSLAGNEVKKERKLLIALSGSKLKKLDYEFNNIDSNLLKSIEYDRDYLENQDLENGSVIGIKTNEGNYFKMQVEGFKRIFLDSKNKEDVDSGLQFKIVAY